MLITIETFTKQNKTKPNTHKTNISFNESLKSSKPKKKQKKILFIIKPLPGIIQHNLFFSLR